MHELSVRCGTAALDPAPQREDRQPRRHVPGTRRHERPHQRRPIRAPRHDDALDRRRRLRQVAVAARTGHVDAHVARGDELPGGTDREAEPVRDTVRSAAEKERQRDAAPDRRRHGRT